MCKKFGENQKLLRKSPKNCLRQMIAIDLAFQFKFQMNVSTIIYTYYMVQDPA